MPATKKPEDYDEFRQSVYLGQCLSDKVHGVAKAQGWTVSKTIRIALYYNYGMMKEVGEELST